MSVVVFVLSWGLGESGKEVLSLSPPGGCWAKDMGGQQRHAPTIRRAERRFAREKFLSRNGAVAERQASSVASHASQSIIAPALRPDDHDAGVGEIILEAGACRDLTGYLLRCILLHFRTLRIEATPLLSCRCMIQVEMGPTR